MRFIPEWQKVVHARNVEKGFYDHEKDLAIVELFLTEFGDNGTFKEALKRLLGDYKRTVIGCNLLLAIGEICEAHEELRKGHDPVHDACMTEKHEFDGTRVYKHGKQF